MNYLPAKLLRSTGAALALAVTVTLTAGCASSSRESLPSEFHEWAFTQARTTDIPAQAHNRLEDGRQGDRVEFGDTSWGQQTEFLINERYFAASGRPCFRGEISYRPEQASEHNHENAVVCRYRSDHWVATRAVAKAINQADHREQSNSGGARP